METLRNLFRRREPEPERVITTPQLYDGAEVRFDETNIPEEDRKATIGREEVAKARALMRKYKDAKANLERRITENERWYQLQHWDSLSDKQPGEPNTSSAWLFNSIANKHADAMDNYPEPIVLPREESDEHVAKTLTDILPVVMEQNDFEKVYSDAWWQKLKTGTAVYKVTWDNSKQNGLGDIAITNVDLLNLFWQPGVKDIQRSQNIFHVELVDNNILEAMYPQLRNQLGQGGFQIAEYVTEDYIDTTDKTIVVDWYYKRSVDGKDIVHYCKFVGDEVLFASENDPEMRERGYYDHGEYPFVFDVLFPEPGMPVGFGYVDVCKNPQLYIDKLDDAILKNAVMSARPRFFYRADGSINQETFADYKNDFVPFSGGGSPQDSIMQITVPQLPGIALTVRQQKIDELKETSGNRDFSQGATTSGVTAASAIAALQEAGNKLSRDMLKTSYRCYAEINTMIVELMRQFYTEQRYFRITGEDGAYRFEEFDNRMLQPLPTPQLFSEELAYRLPVFDIRIKAQKSSPFSTAAQNERAKELYSMGFFNPQLADQALACLDMMQFEGIEKVREKISQNGTLLQQIQMMQQQMLQMAQIIDSQNPGYSMAQSMAQQFAIDGQTAMPNAKPQGEMEVNGLADAIGRESARTPGGARAAAARSATPR